MSDILAEMEKLLEDIKNCPASGNDCILSHRVNELKNSLTSLIELIERDALTGLYNFRFFLNAIKTEVERFKRTGQRFSLIITDIDYFKSINDTFGHVNGNIALKHFAKLLLTNTRPTDIVCRYGGEEFALILPGTNLIKAIKIAERLRKVISESPITIDNREIKLTASFGVGMFEEAFSNKIEINEFIHHVDMLLLSAKKTGRNKVVHSKIISRSETQLDSDEREFLYSIKNKANE